MRKESFSISKILLEKVLMPITQQNIHWILHDQDDWYWKYKYYFHILYLSGNAEGSERLNWHTNYHNAKKICCINCINFYILVNIKDKCLFHDHLPYRPKNISHNVYVIQTAAMKNIYPLNKDSLRSHPLRQQTLPPQALLPTVWMDWQTDLESLGHAATHTPERTH